MYDTQDYMAHWPGALPYPYALTRSQRPVPNASSVTWPQSQFAPLFLAPGSPSFQPYVYRKKPARFPVGARVFSTSKGPDTLPYSIQQMTPALRRQWASLPGGGTARVPLSYGLVVNPKAGGFVDKLRSQMQPTWESQLTTECRAVYESDIARAAKLSGVQKALAERRAQAAALACQKRAKEAHEAAEYDMLKQRKLETQETAADQAAFQTELMARQADLESAEVRNRRIMWGVGGIFLVGVTFAVVQRIRGKR